MKSYIASCTAPNGDLRSRHVEARNHLAAVKQVQADGFTVLSVERDDDTRPRSRKRRKRLFISIVVCTLLAALCIAVVWLRSRHHF